MCVPERDESVCVCAFCSVCVRERERDESVCFVLRMCVCCLWSG